MEGSEEDQSVELGMKGREPGFQLKRSKRDGGDAGGRGAVGWEARRAAAEAMRSSCRDVGGRYDEGTGDTRGRDRGIGVTGNEDSVEAADESSETEDSSNSKSGRTGGR